MKIREYHRKITIWNTNVAKERSVRLYKFLQRKTRMTLGVTFRHHIAADFSRKWEIPSERKQHNLQLANQTAL
jgi:hypothetical protein